MPNRLRRMITAALTLAAGLYLALLAAGCLGYRAVLFPAPRSGGVIAPRGATLREIRSKDGVVMPAVHFPAPAGAPTIVHFHGNGETLQSELSLGVELHRRELGVLLVEYRGYGSAPGAPSEEAFYLDAEAALDLLEADGVGRDRVVLSGISLGTGVAAEMAARGRGARLVLIAPYTSIPRLAGRIAPFLPASVIVRDRFDTLSKADRLRVPTLIIHGDRDEIIPFDMGQALAGAITGAKLVTVAGGHHNDLFALHRDLVGVIAAHANGPR